LTLSTTASRVSYSGNGATTVFAFAFKIWAASNLKVYLRDNASLADTLQTLTTHYTLDIVTYPNTGNVIFTTAPPSGKTIVIVRDMPLTQELDLIASGAFAAENVETQLDKLAAEHQTLREMLARGLRLPVGTAHADLTLPEPVPAVANQILGVKSAGDGFEFKRVVDLPAQTVSPFMTTLLDDADADAARATLGIVSAAGATVSGTVGGTSDAITLTTAPALGAYAVNQRFIVKAASANTAVNPTLNVDTLGAKTITGPGGAALDVGAWATGDMLLLAYDGAALQLISRLRFSDLRLQVNAQTGTTYTVLTGDRGKLVTYNNAAAVAVTLPQANTTTFAAGWFHFAENLGAGEVTITPTTSTINGAATLILQRGQWALIVSDGANYRALRGGAPGKATIWVPASAMVPRTTAGAAAGTVETATNRVMIKTLDFDTTTQEFAQFSVAMPKGWNEGTVSFVPVWSHAATATNFGVAWTLAGLALSDDDALDQAFGTAITVTDTGGTTNDLYRGPESAPVTIAGAPVENDVVIFQLARDPANGADTMAIDARLHGIALYITYDAPTDR
jgi:hypothetical protein